MVSRGNLAGLWLVSTLVAGGLGAVGTAASLADGRADQAAAGANPVMLMAAQTSPTPAKPSDPRLHTGARVERAGDGLFYIQALVNGHPLRFILDTGASMMVLSPQDAMLAGVALGDPVTTTTVDGTAPMRRATIAKLELAGRPLRNLPAVVAGQGQISLIGQNALSQLDEVVIRGDQMILR